MAELHRATGLPLASRPVVTDFAELRRAIELGSVQIVFADHHYWGGLRDLRPRGLDALELPPRHQPAGDRTRRRVGPEPGRWRRTRCCAGGKVPIVHGCVAIGRAPGLGVELDPERLARLSGQFLACGIRLRDDARQKRR